MIDVGKQVRVLSGTRKGQEGTIVAAHTGSDRRGVPYGFWLVRFPEGRSKSYMDEALEELMAPIN